MAEGGLLQVVAAGVVAFMLVVLLGALAAGRRRADGSLSILEHIEELRRRLLLCIAAFVAGTLVALSVRVDWNGPWPIPTLDVYDNLSAQLFRMAAAHLVPANVHLVVTSPLDGFTAQFAWSLSLGFAVALPVMLVQLGRFFGPALRPRESRLLLQAVVPTTLLFVTGAAFAYLFVLPVTLAALYGFSDALGASPLLDVHEFSSFTLAFLVGFGLAFETPVVLVVLARTGLVEGRTFLRQWKHALVAALVAGMVLTPDPTIVSQLLLAGPVFLLYLVGALWASRRPRAAEAQDA